MLPLEQEEFAMPCVFCEMGICVDHNLSQAYKPGRFQPQSSEPRMMRIFDIRGPSFLPRDKPTPVKPTPSIIVHGLPLRDYLRLKTAPPGKRVDVRKYADGWKKGSQIVKDAKSLRLAWENAAKRKRGEVNWKSSEPEENMCSGENWEPIDEGMDVAREIEDVDSQENRDEEGNTFWRAYRFPSEAVGILITQNAVEHGDGKVELGIRWLVGHPTIKGAGTVLMAKADELHRTAKYKESPMHVIASASSVGWYKSKGFEVESFAKCNDDETPCGCVIMKKPRPPQ